ncbi:MAG: hypothetical protein AAB834_00855, partial [Patescibacteria group bacterium]
GCMPVAVYFTSGHARKCPGLAASDAEIKPQRKLAAGSSGMLSVSKSAVIHRTLCPGRQPKIRF